MSVDTERIDNMIKEAPAAINFTVFLSMLADKLHGNCTVLYCVI